VDDSPFNLIALEGQIIHIEKKLKVVQATSGEEAVAIFKRDREKTCCNTWIKFVIMDIEMQIIDGVAAATALFDICKSVQNQERSSFEDPVVAPKKKDMVKVIGITQNVS